LNASHWVCIKMNAIRIDTYLKQLNFVIDHFWGEAVRNKSHLVSKRSTAQPRLQVVEDTRTDSRRPLQIVDLVSKRDQSNSCTGGRRKQKSCMRLTYVDKPKPTVNAPFRLLSWVFELYFRGETVQSVSALCGEVVNARLMPKKKTEYLYLYNSIAKENCARWCLERKDCTSLIVLFQHYHLLWRKRGRSSVDVY